MRSPKAMFVGSANMDLVIRVHRFPRPGETLQGYNFQTFPGGKGSNQASAAGRLGGNVSLIAKVGQDAFGSQLVAALRESSVATDGVLSDDSAPTGVALITVDDAGQNSIVLAPGANARLSASEVETGLSGDDFSVLVAQLEVPLEAVLAAATNANGSIFILNPAPAKALPDALLGRVDFLTPNEGEAQLLTGVFPGDDESCLACARVLLDRGVRNVVITLGEKGAYWATEHGGKHFSSLPVKAVDTTGAGDTFNGALAIFLGRGEEVERAIALANVAGALSTTKRGAQASAPTLDEVLQHANRLS